MTLHTPFNARHGKNVALEHPCEPQAINLSYAHKFPLAGAATIGGGIYELRKGDL